jgi:hypothetical protein
VIGGQTGVEDGEGPLVEATEDSADSVRRGGVHVRYSALIF